MTRNQRRHAEKSVNITDFINDFRTACLNRARDVRNFADSRDSIVLNEAEWKQLRELTDMLTEQLGFLQDAWDKMMRLVEKHKIDLENDEAYKTTELARAHTLRVATVAFQIADRFLLSQEDEIHVSKPRNEDRERESENTPEEETGAVAKEEEARHNEPVTNNVNKPSEEIREAVGANKAIENSEAPPRVRQEATRPLQHEGREKAMRGKLNEKTNLAGAIVQNNLTERLKGNVDESSTGDGTHEEERTTEIAYRATA